MPNLKKLILIMLCVACGTAVGQTYTTKMRHCVTGSGVVLRWAPADYATWRIADTMGYTIKRYTILRNNEVLEPEEIQNPANIVLREVRPAPLEAWESFANEKYVAIAAECIYGETEQSVTKSTARGIYQQYRQQQQRFAFALYAADMSPKAAELSGLMFLDSSVKPNEKYLYHVYLGNLPDTVRQDTAMDFVNAGIETPLANIPTPTATSADHAVNIQIDVTYINDYYTSYVVERSDDCGETFHALSDENTIGFSSEESDPNIVFYTDSLPVNNVPFQYRVRGIDCFGRMSQPSDTVEAAGSIPLSAVPTIVDYNVIDNRRIELEWQFPDSMNASITGFRIYVQSGPKVPLRRIYEGTSSHQRKFIDDFPDMTNYYKISAYNHETEMLTPYFTYVQLTDSFPPAPPVGLAGVIDSSGVVSLSWNANTESDLAGYRVYYSNLPNVEFALLSNEIFNDTVYQTSVNLNTLTRKIYYQVKAIDVRDNLSGPSETLELSRPDTIAPSSPVMKGVTSADGYPKVTWRPSGSSDVVSHKVMRRLLTDSAYVEVWASADKSVGEYIDSAVMARSTYVYQIVAVDEAGNESKPSDPFRFRVSIKENAMPLKVRNEAGKVKLSWTNADPRATHYVIFRAVNDEPLKPYTQTTECTYEDVHIKLDNAYSYAVKAIFADGSESVLSEIMTVK